VWNARGDLIGIAIELAADDHGAHYLVSEDIGSQLALREITAFARATINVADVQGHP
jgi:hypothetical protein